VTASGSRTFRGVPASGGVAAGPARVLATTDSLRAPIAVRDAESLRDPALAAIRLDDALDQVATDLRALEDRLRAGGRTEEADIVGVGALIADDPSLRADARREVGEGRGPAEAVLRAAERHALAIAAIGDPTLAERAADVRQVGRRAAAILTSGSAAGDEAAQEQARGPDGTAPEAVQGSTDAPPRIGGGGSPRGGQSPNRGRGAVVLLADELGPADILGMEDGEIAAAAAVRGGPNAHAAIVARSLGLPLVLGIDAAALSVPDGAAVVVDGDRGWVTIEPEQPEMAAAREAMGAASRRKATLAAGRSLPVETVDGVGVTLLCNVATAAETRAGLAAGAEGVGLLRTELPFLDVADWPDEAAHRRVLDPILSQLHGRVATVRVLDFGGDKVPRFLSAAPGGADGQARGLPPLLRTPDALGSQLRAALRAGAGTRLRILVPMVTSLREVRLAREELDQAVAATGSDGAQMGVMVEVPSAALLAERLATEVDFLSIGTNDLTERVLGIHRRDPGARPALAAHPTVITLVNRVVKAGKAQGKPVGVCGEAAADPLVLPLLVGIGVGSVSVSPSRVDEVRARVRALSAEKCRQVARAAMRKDSAEAVWDLVRERALPDV
jgi:phosphoenolpyruvate-protein kinase (PTS system EI component)